MSMQDNFVQIRAILFLIPSRNNKSNFVIADALLTFIANDSCSKPLLFRFINVVSLKDDHYTILPCDRREFITSLFPETP